MKKPAPLDQLRQVRDLIDMLDARPVLRDLIVYLDLHPDLKELLDPETYREDAIQRGGAHVVAVFEMLTRLGVLTRVGRGRYRLREDKR